MLAITFTRNACDEMKARLRRLLGHAVASNVVVLTIHSFCLRVLRRHLQELGGSFTYSGNDFTIASKREQVFLTFMILVIFAVDVLKSSVKLANFSPFPYTPLPTPSLSSCCSTPLHQDSNFLI